MSFTLDLQAVIAKADSKPLLMTSEKWELVQKNFQFLIARASGKDITYDDLPFFMDLLNECMQFVISSDADGSLDLSALLRVSGSGLLHNIVLIRDELRKQCAKQYYLDCLQRENHYPKFKNFLKKFDFEISVDASGNISAVNGQVFNLNWVDNILLNNLLDVPNLKIDQQTEGMIYADCRRDLRHQPEPLEDKILELEKEVRSRIDQVKCSLEKIDRMARLIRILLATKPGLTSIPRPDRHLYILPLSGEGGYMTMREDEYKVYIDFKSYWLSQERPGFFSRAASWSPPPNKYKCMNFPRTYIKNWEKTMVIPDLHANVVLGLNLLIQFGVVKCAKDDFEAMSRIYKELCYYQAYQDLFTEQDAFVARSKANQCHKRFATLLDKIEIDGAKASLVKFIGDATGDRGASDALVMKLINKVMTASAGTGCCILASNHG